MFLSFKPKIVFGFLLSIFSFFMNIYSMEVTNRAVEKIQEDTANNVYRLILEKLKGDQKKSKYLNGVQNQEDEILKTFKLEILNSLNNLKLKELLKNSKLLEDFAKSLVDKISNRFDLFDLTLSSSDGSSSSTNPKIKLSEIVQLDNCDKFVLTFSLIQEIKEAMQPSGLIRLDHKQIKKACKRCGKLTCVCCVGSCICITCAGVGYQHPMAVQGFIEDFPKCSVCVLSTGLTCCFDQCCCRGYLFKEMCSVVKNMLGGIKCWFCGCCDNDEDKDFKF